MSADAPDAAGLAGGVALVTGASSGLGRATALRLARAARTWRCSPASVEDAVQEVHGAARPGRRARQRRRNRRPGRRDRAQRGGVGPGAGVNLRAVFLLCPARASRHGGRRAADHREHLLRGRQARLGQRLRLLRLEVRPHRVHAGAGGGGPRPRRPRVRPVFRSHGDELGHLVGGGPGRPSGRAGLAAGRPGARDGRRAHRVHRHGPPGLVLNEAFVSPLQGQGWP
jgi:hypothetical protein